MSCDLFWSILVGLLAAYVFIMVAQVVVFLILILF